MPWYRPTRLNHVSAGAEFGWRSGWAKWPNYFVDSLPPDPGNGPRLAGRHGSLQPLHVSRSAITMRCSSAIGRAAASWPSAPSRTAPPTRPRPRCSSKASRSTSPISRSAPTAGCISAPAAATPKAASTASCGTARCPPEVLNRGKGIAAALEQPQLTSAWARQQVALVKQQLGDDWATATERRRAGRSKAPRGDARARVGVDAALRAASDDRRCWSTSRTTARRRCAPRRPI